MDDIAPISGAPVTGFQSTGAWSLSAVHNQAGIGIHAGNKRGQAVYQTRRRRQRPGRVWAGAAGFVRAR